MSEPVHVPHPPSGLMSKKVGGIPVLYLAGGFVLILAVYAYKTKKSASAVTTAAATTATTTGNTQELDANGNPMYDANGNAIMVDSSGNVVSGTTLAAGTVYPSMPSGSVTGTTASTAGTNSSIVTNDDWIKAGVAFLITRGVGAGIAQDALQAYLHGDQLTYVQGGYRDTVIGQYGLPPTLLPTGGTALPIVAPVAPVVTPVKPPPPSALTHYPAVQYDHLSRDSKTGAIYGIFANGQSVHLTPTQYSALGSPHFDKTGHAYIIYGPR